MTRPQRFMTLNLLTLAQASGERRRSLAGISVRYEDAWAATHPDAAGHTFSPRTRWSAPGRCRSSAGRRIDYILVRSGACGPALDVAASRLVFEHPEEDAGPATTTA